MGIVLLAIGLLVLFVCIWRDQTKRSGRLPGTSAGDRCSSCNEDHNAVRKLIAGPTVFICDACVDVCNDIVAGDRRLEVRVSGSKKDAGCTLCSAGTTKGELLLGPRGSLLCEACDSAVNAAATDRRGTSDPGPILTRHDGCRAGSCGAGRTRRSHNGMNLTRSATASGAAPVAHAQCSTDQRWFPASKGLVA